MAMEELSTYQVVCEGGLDSNQNFLALSTRKPGAATTLQNFEPSLSGGYRRISGFSPYDDTNAEVDSAGAEGAILGLSIYDDLILAARKQQSGNTYKIYKSAANWTDLVAPNRTYTVGMKIRNETFNFSDGESVIFVDGVNKAAIYNGTTWAEIDSTATGADAAHAGGNQALDKPSLVAIFKNTVFISGDPDTPTIVSYSAPSDPYDWTAASGGGQIVVPFKVKAIKPFRDELYVFGAKRISKIVLNSTTFVIQDVSKEIGCLAPDSVVEVNGDLQFIAQDGIRTIAGTTKIGDVELAILSKPIQNMFKSLIRVTSLDDICSVVIRSKSQVRYFFSDPEIDDAVTKGILGGLREDQGNLYWEWSVILGMRPSCTVSEYIGAEEYILHGGYDGVVYRQEVGDSFNGTAINAIYETPYLDFGDVFIRKTFHKLFIFVKLEGVVSINMQVQYDWDSSDATNPSVYILEQDQTNSLYGTGIYGTATYGAAPLLIEQKYIEGSGMSIRLTFYTNDINPSYVIQGIGYEFLPNGRK